MAKAESPRLTLTIDHPRLTSNLSISAGTPARFASASTSRRRPRERRGAAIRMRTLEVAVALEPGKDRLRQAPHGVGVRVRGEGVKGEGGGRGRGPRAGAAFPTRRRRTGTDDRAPPGRSEVRAESSTWRRLGVTAKTTARTCESRGKLAGAAARSSEERGSIPSRGGVGGEPAEDLVAGGARQRLGRTPSASHATTRRISTLIADGSRLSITRPHTTDPGVRLAYAATSSPLAASLHESAERDVLVERRKARHAREPPSSTGVTLVRARRRPARGTQYALAHRRIERRHRALRSPAAPSRRGNMKGRDADAVR